MFLVTVAKDHSNSMYSIINSPTVGHTFLVTYLHLTFFLFLYIFFLSLPPPLPSSLPLFLSFFLPPPSPPSPPSPLLFFFFFRIGELLLSKKWITGLPISKRKGHLDSSALYWTLSFLVQNEWNAKNRASAENLNQNLNQLLPGYMWPTQLYVTQDPKAQQKDSRGKRLPGSPHHL